MVFADGAARSTASASVPAGQPALRRFREYVEPEIAVLLRVGLTLTGSWPDSEDLVQETLIRAWKSIDRFDGAHPRAWLLTILRHAHLNTLRRQRPAITGDPVSLETAARPAFGASPPRSPADELDDLTLGADLEVAIASLDPRLRVTLLLIDVDQLTYSEAAGVLDVPVGTVMSRLSRAREQVRRRLPPNRFRGNQ
jgi:RNA polymerase sigma-70 factor (ECF subfamily)